MPRKRKTLVALHRVPDHNNYRYDIVGESYRLEKIQALVKKGRPMLRQSGDWLLLGVRFWLVPEPTNSYDPNAVMVLAGPREFNQARSVLVGYINRGDAKSMSHRLDGPLTVFGMIIGQEGNFGVKLDRPTLDRAELLTAEVDSDEAVSEVEVKVRL